MTGHIRQRSLGAFEIRYPVNGKTRTATVRGTRKEADRELRRLLRLVDTGAHANNPDRLTVGEWLDRWLAIVRPEISPVSFDGYSRIVRNYLRPSLGTVKLSKLSPADVQAMHSRLAERGNLAASSRALVNKVLSASLNRAVELELVGRNVCHAIRRRAPKAEHREQAVLDLATMQTALDAAEEPYKLAILIGLATGARRGEICALQWRHLDGATLTIAESVTQVGGVLRRAATKTGRSRRISLPETIVEQLRTHKTGQAEDLLRLGVRQTPDHPIVAWPNGSPVQPVTLTGYSRRLFDRLGLPALHFHSLRHTSATILLEAGASARVAQQRLGHANVSMTLGIYSHVTERLESDAAERIDNVLRGLR